MPNPIIKPLTAADIPAGIVVDLASQHIRRMPDGHTQLAITVYCRKCGKESIRGVSHLRYRIRKIADVGYCNLCVPKRKPLTSGGVKITEGYRYLHYKIIEPYIVQMFKDAGMRIDSRHAYIQEHRVVAARTYGAMVTWPGILIRHKDGNKLNNVPGNLLIGTDQDNKDDHMTSIRKMIEWRMTAMLLWDLLRFNLSK